MSTRVLDATHEADILSRFDGACFRDGLLQVMPADFYAREKQNDIMIWCVRRGLYCLPTLELIDFLRQEIGTDTAIEIGAGHGAIGRALGMVITDSKQQERSDVVELYGQLGQAPVKYPADVEKLTALEAMEKYRPSVAVGAWVTHRYDPKAHARGGNVSGVDEGKLLAKACLQRYIFIGHERMHAQKPILARSHVTHRPGYLYSRAFDPLNVVWIWTPSHGGKWPTTLTSLPRRRT